MCYPVSCPLCGKVTWAGCGLHADTVMLAVPPGQRCTCGSEALSDDMPRSGR